MVFAGLTVVIFLFVFANLCYHLPRRFALLPISSCAPQNTIGSNKCFQVDADPALAYESQSLVMLVQYGRKASMCATTLILDNV